MIRTLICISLWLAASSAHAGQLFYTFYNERSIMAEGSYDEVFWRFRVTPPNEQNAKQWSLGPLTDSDSGTTFIADTSSGDWPQLSDYLTNNNLNYLISTGLTFVPGVYEVDDTTAFRKPANFTVPGAVVDYAVWELYSLTIEPILIDDTLHTRAVTTSELRLYIQVPGPPTIVLAMIAAILCAAASVSSLSLPVRTVALGMRWFAGSRQTVPSRT